MGGAVEEWTEPQGAGGGHVEEWAEPYRSGRSHKGLGGAAAEWAEPQGSGQSSMGLGPGTPMELQRRQGRGGAHLPPGCGGGGISSPTAPPGCGRPKNHRY